MKKRNMIRWILGIPVIVLTLILVILIFEPEKSGITRAAARLPISVFRPAKSSLSPARARTASACSRRRARI